MYGNYTIYLRRDTNDNWVRINPVIRNNEPVIDMDRSVDEPNLKIGNGVSRWNDIPYQPIHINPTIVTSGSYVNFADFRVFSGDTHAR